MEYVVTIFAGSTAYWSACVWAEDGEGAVREAMTLLDAGRGSYRLTSRAGGPLSVDVAALDPDVATFAGLLRRAAR